MENASSHIKDLIEVRGQVEIIQLPPNVTFAVQPMNLGVIAAWKKSYRKIMLRTLISDIETHYERRELNRRLKDGMKGIHKGYAPNMFNFAHMSKKAWDLTIARCWRNSDIFAVGNARTFFLFTVSRGVEILMKILSL